MGMLFLRLIAGKTDPGEKTKNKLIIIIIIIIIHTSSQKIEQLTIEGVREIRP